MEVVDRPPPMFVADARGLDVLNTVASPFGTSIEWLGDGPDLLGWLEAADLIPADVSRRMRSAERGELDAAAAEARALREWFRGFVTAHKGSSLGVAARRKLSRLNVVLERESAYGEVVSSPDVGDAGPRWQWRRRWRTPGDLLTPIARAMAEVICEADFRLVKKCEAPACTMVFLDTTKSHARRWCSMAVCGNRAKQAAHRARAYLRP